MTTATQAKPESKVTIRLDERTAKRLRLTAATLGPKMANAIGLAAIRCFLDLAEADQRAVLGLEPPSEGEAAPKATPPKKRKPASQ